MSLRSNSPWTKTSFYFFLPTNSSFRFLFLTKISYSWADNSPFWILLVKFSPFRLRKRTNSGSWKRGKFNYFCWAFLNSRKYFSLRIFFCNCRNSLLFYCWLWMRRIISAFYRFFIFFKIIQKFLLWIVFWQFFKAITSFTFVFKANQFLISELS